MKILYISNFYTLRNSSAAVRNNSLVKGLLELGHEVDVLTVRQSETSTSPDLHYGNIIYTDLFNLSFRKELKNKINIRVKNFLGDIYLNVMTTIHFPDSYYKWPSKVVVKQLGNYDLMISSSDSKISHFVGKRIKSFRNNLKWIQIWGDPWYDDLNSNLLDKIRISYYEKKFLSLADKVVYVSQPTCNLMKSKYSNLADKITFIPRSYFNEFVYNIPDGKEYHIVYTGAIFSNYGRNITNFAHAIEQYNLDKNIRKIVLDVYGDVNNDEKKALESQYVNFYDGVDVSKLSDVYKFTNALLYISNKASSTQIPGKFYDYLGTSSLILCLVNNKEDEIAQFFQGFGRRCLLVNNTEEEILSSLDKIVELMSKTYNPDQAFSPKNVARQIAALV